MSDRVVVVAGLSGVAVVTAGGPIGLVRRAGDV